MADKTAIAQLREMIDSMEARSPGAFGSDAVPASGEGRKRGSKDPGSAGDAFSKIIALVNASDRSEHMVRERLSRAEFDAGAIDEAVERAKAYGFIDDGRFAAVLVRSRLSQGKGVPGIERELRSQGIELDSVPGWPEEFDIEVDSELERAVAFLERKPPRSKNPRDGAYRKLIGKGYSSSVAAAAARAWVEQRIATG